MHFYAVELDKAGEAVRKPRKKPADRTPAMVVSSVNDASVGSDRQSRPLFKVFARR